MSEPNQAPTLLTVEAMRQALNSLPAMFNGALVLCNGKPAHTLDVVPASPDREATLNIKFYMLGDL